MIEKLSLDFVRKIYNILTTGNDDVNFYCMCLQNQNREAATNNPVKFGLELIKINILCRLPFCNKRIFTKTVGKDYLSQIFVRPSICELASGMLDNSHLVTDIFGSALNQIKDDDKIFTEIENVTGVKGFALLRKKYGKQGLTISRIYKKINAELKTLIDYKLELSLVENSFFENRYIVRMIDIAHCNNMKVSVVIRSIYPKEFIKHLLDSHQIGYDELIVTNGNNNVIETDDKSHTCVMSNNYDFIKKYAKIMIRRHIGINYSGTGQVVYTDGKWIAFMLEQILSNAIKYTPQGVVTIETAEEKDRFFITIKDTGIGIKAEDLPRVFEKGYTGYNGHADKKATGIGLYLCRQMADKLGHTIRMESEIGKGTKVWIGFDLDYADTRD